MNSNVSYFLTEIAKRLPWVFKSGSEVEHNRFWDAFQTNHNNNTRRTNYEYAFAGQGWNNDILKPKYDITPSTATGMFLNTQYNGDLRDFPVKLDFSNCTAFTNCFAYAYELTSVGVVDTRSASSLTAMFLYCRKLETIEKWFLKDDGSQTYGTNPFTQCYKLRNIAVEGVLGKTISFGDSKELSKDSIVSIIEALKLDASGQTLTLSANAVNNNGIDWSNTVVKIKNGDTVTTVTCNTFKEVTDTKSDWNISLA